MPMRRRRMFALAAMFPLPVISAIAEPIETTNAEEIDTAGPAAANAAIIRRHHAVLNTGDVVAAAAFFATDTRNHGVPVGRKGVLRVLTDIFTTFPDWRMEIEDLSAIDNDVIVRMIVTGTHKGIGRIPVNGGLLVGVPPTGKSFKVQHIHWYTLKDGLITDHRANRDDVGMMQELGLLPSVARYDLPKK